MAGDPSSPVGSATLCGGVGGSASRGDESGSPISIPHTIHGVPVINEEQSESSPEEENQSTLFTEVLQGRAPEVQFVVNGNEYNMGYYLTDGIYPE
ncbi:unnamed protein product [Urochloa humidicola]